MKLLSSNFIVAFIAGSTLLLNGCSFKKNANEKPETPSPTVIVEKPAAEPTSALEALLASDTESFEKHLAPMSSEQVNAYQKDGSTLLEVAVRQSNLDAVEKLLAKGALPLKPRKNSETTPLSLAQKMNESMAKILEESIAKKKADIVFMVKERKYTAALDVLRANFLKQTDLLSEGQYFIDLTLSQEQTLTVETKKLANTLLLEKAPLVNSKEKVLLLSLTDADLFAVAINAVVNQKLNLDTEFISNLISQNPLTTLKENLKVLNSNNFIAKERLSNLQRQYIDKIITSVRPGELLNLTDFQSTLALLITQSVEYSFCSDCIELALTHDSFKAQRGDIIRLLVINSEQAPKGFVKSLLGRINLNDFQQIVGVLSKTARQAQLDAFDGTWSVDEFKIMKSLGMKMSASQAVKHLKNLFAARFEGDVKATKTLTDLQGEWVAAKGLLSADDQITLFTKEFMYVFNSDLQQKDLLSILTSVIDVQIEGLLVGEIPKTDKVNLLGQIEKEKLWMNPLHLFKHKKAHEMSMRFETLAPDLLKATLHIIPELKKDWFLKTASWTISEHHLHWADILENDTALLKMLPQLKNDLVANLFRQWTWKNGYNIETIEARLSATNPWFLTTNSEYRQTYLPILLISGFSPIKNSILLEMINGTPKLNSLNEPSFAMEFASYIKSIPTAEQRDAVFASVFMQYVLKQNPRFRKVIETETDLYLSFLKGNLSSDPLCAGNIEETYKSHCQYMVSENKEIGSFSKDQAKDPRLVRERLEALRRAEQERVQRITNAIANDKITILALLELSQIAKDGSAMAEFFKNNSWIFKVQFASEQSTIFPQLPSGLNFPKTGSR